MPGELIRPVLGPARTDDLVELAWHIDELTDAAALADAMVAE
jgi:hypothetical protein